MNGDQKETGGKHCYHKRQCPEAESPQRFAYCPFCLGPLFVQYYYLSLSHQPSFPFDYRSSRFDYNVDAPALSPRPQLIIGGQPTIFRSAVEEEPDECRGNH